MRFSRLGLLFLIISTVLFGANCSFYNRIFARKDLVDGAKAYKDRKFAEAEQLFRNAVARDPSGQTTEGKTAQLFLARTLHSEYIGDRQKKSLAEDAIAQYQKVLAEDPNDQSSFKAIANLYENLERNEDYLKWVTDRSNNAAIKPEYRAEALTSLAAKQNTCANDISDTDKTKKTVAKNGKQEYQFVKPENADDFAKLKQCSDAGLELASKAVELDPNSDSAWSYKTSLLIQKMRVAEMEGNAAQKDQYKSESDVAKAKFTQLADARREKEKAEEEKKKAAEDAAANKK